MWTVPVHFETFGCRSGAAIWKFDGEFGAFLGRFWSFFACVLTFRRSDASVWAWNIGRPTFLFAGLERIVVIGFYFGVTSFGTFVFWVGFGALENLVFFGLFGLRPGVRDSSVPRMCSLGSIFSGFFFILANGPVSKFEEGEEEGGCFHPQILVVCVASGVGF
jgi:hypothetical protein